MGDQYYFLHMDLVSVATEIFTTKAAALAEN
jgi:hypothetical protein